MAKQLVLWEEQLPGYVVTREPSFFAPLPSCAAFQRGAPEFVVLVQFLAVRDLPLGPLAQEEPSAEARRGLFGELAEFSVSRPISLVPPMLSPGHPSPFSVVRVVVQQLNLVFGTSKVAQTESATRERKFFHVISGLHLDWWWTKKSERFSMSNES